MSMNFETTGILTSGHPLIPRDGVDAIEGSAERIPVLPPPRVAARQALLVRLFPVFICAQAFLIAALLLLNYLDSIG